MNKTDLMADENLGAAREQLLESLDWQGRVFEVSAATGEGTEALAQAIVQELELLGEEADARDEKDATVAD